MEKTNEGLNLMPEEPAQKKANSFDSAVEEKVYAQLLQNGWNVIYEMSHREFPFSMTLGNDRRVFRPDFTLLDQDQKTIGFVEVLFNTHMLPQKARILQDLLHIHKPPIAIITNGYVYDIYIKGEHFSQTHFCPGARMLDALRKEVDGNV